MEENKVDYESYLNGYKEISKQIDELDLEKRVETLESEIKELEKQIEEKGQEYKVEDDMDNKTRNMAINLFEMDSKELMKQINDRDTEIRDIKDNHVEDKEERQAKINELKKYKQNVKDNAEKEMKTKREELEKSFILKEDELAKENNELMQKFLLIQDSKAKEDIVVNKQLREKMKANRIANMNLGMEKLEALEKFDNEYNEFLNELNKIDGIEIEDGSKEPPKGAEGEFGEPEQEPESTATAGTAGQPGQRGFTARPNGGSGTPGASTPPIGRPQQKPLEIVLGNKGTISYDGKQYPISTDIIRKGLYLNKEFANGQIKNDELVEMLDIDENILKRIRLIDAKTPIDFTVCLAMNQLDIPIEERNTLMKGYIYNALKSQAESKKAKHQDLSFEEKLADEYKSRKDIKVTYDMDKLSKVPFWKTLFSINPLKENLTGEEKEEFAQLANKAYRYGLGKTVGQYKETFTNKVLNFFKGKHKLLPAPQEMNTVDTTNSKTIDKTTQKEQKVAKYYNEHIQPNIGDPEKVIESLTEGVNKFGKNTPEAEELNDVTLGEKDKGDER